VPPGDWPPALGDIVAYALFVKDAKRFWHLGKVTGSRVKRRKGESEQMVSVEMFGTNDADLLRGEYFPAKCNPIQGQPDWEIGPHVKQGDIREIEWGSVFVFGILPLQKNKLADQDRQEIEKEFAQVEKAREEEDKAEEKAEKKKTSKTKAQKKKKKYSST
jgi:hypothetical protein